MSAIRRSLTRVSDPAAEPVTLDEAKLFLRIDHDEEDELITALIAAARIAAEEHLRRSLITQSWKLALDGGTPSAVALARGPVSGVTSVTAFDRAGDSAAIGASAYYLDAAQECLVFDSLISAHRLEIVYTAGYGASAGSVPAPLKQGMLAHIAALYERRGDAEMPMPQEAAGLYAPYRVVEV